MRPRPLFPYVPMDAHAAHARPNRTNADAVSAAGGFTIIEIIVVIVLLGILGAVVAPRLSSLGGKQARADAQSVAELLSIAARRDDLTSQPVAIEYDRERGTIVMLTFSPPDSSGSAPVWRTDRLAPQAELRSTVVAEAQADGNELDSSHWRLEFSQNSRRPALSVLLQDTVHGDLWRVQLAAGATRATIGLGSASGVASDGAIDLDAAGRSEEAW